MLLLWHHYTCTKIATVWCLCHKLFCFSCLCASWIPLYCCLDSNIMTIKLLLPLNLNHFNIRKYFCDKKTRIWMRKRNQKTFCQWKNIVTTFTTENITKQNEWWRTGAGATVLCFSITQQSQSEPVHLWNTAGFPPVTSIIHHQTLLQ